MKIIHVSDLHIGKQVHGVSMLGNGDQPFWIEKFTELVKNEQPEAIVIAGDVYDRAAPSRDAIEAVDKLLTSLASLEFKPAVMMIAGNHDSGALVGYFKEIASKHNIYIAGIADTQIEKVTLNDEYGPVDFWLVPYVFPAMINSLLGTDYYGFEEAFRAYLEQQDIDYTRRNVIVSHQNITAHGKEAERGGSETMVGGVGGIDYTVFDGFEYAALGHIHAAQHVGRPAVRYAGSPLCYHFDETKHPKKGPVKITLYEKGKEPDIEIKEIEPLHPMKEIRGTLEDIESAECSSPSRNQFIKAVIIPDADGNLPLRAGLEDRLRTMFSANGSVLMDISFEYAKRTLESEDVTSADASEEKTIDEQLADFWELRNGTAVDEESMNLFKLVLEQSENADEVINADIKKLATEEIQSIKKIVEFAKK